MLDVIFVLVAEDYENVLNSRIEVPRLHVAYSLLLGQDANFEECSNKRLFCMFLLVSCAHIWD